MNRLLLGVVSPLLVASAAFSSGIAVSQSIDRTEVAFEDSVNFEIELTWPGTQFAYLFSKPLSPDFDRFKVRKFSSSISSSGSGEDEVTTRTLKYTLTPESPGLATIQPIEIEYLSWPDSMPGMLFTEVMAVSIAEPVAVSDSGKNALVSWPVGLGLFAIVAIAVVTVFFIMRRRRPKEVTRSPREAFLDDLSQLQAVCGNDLKEFQTGLLKSLTAYLAAEYGIDSASKTSADITRALESTSLAPTHREKIAGWLTRAEKEKYSPVMPGPGETLRLEAEVREFFEKM